MKTTLVLALILSSAVHASSKALRCVGTFNSENMFVTEVSLEEGEHNKLFADHGPFRFFLSNNAGDKIELQAFNGETPSRNYATATMRESGSAVELSIWTRDYLMEASCSL